MDFEQVKGVGFTEASFEGGTDINATLVANTDNLIYKREGSYLDLTGNQWLSLTKNDGTPLLTGKDRITIEYESRYLGSGNSWAFYIDKDQPGDNNKFPRANSDGNVWYLGIIEEWAKVEKYKGKRAPGENQTSDPGSMVLDCNDELLKRNAWKKVTVVIDDRTITMYQDGKEIGTKTSDTAALLSQILGENSAFHIGGHAYWGAGEYYNGYIDNFKVYDGALTAEQVAGTTTGLPPLLADFDFETMAADGTFEDGDRAKAVVKSDNKNVLKSDARTALDLRGKTQALYVTKADGSPILAGVDEATIVLDSYFESDGWITSWPFFASKDVNMQDGGNRNSLALGERTGQLFINAFLDQSVNKTDIDVTVEKPYDPKTGVWKQIAFSFGKDSVKLYIDGTLATEVQNSQQILLSEVLGASGGVFQIGRGNYGDGEHYNGMIDNFQIYNRILTADEVTSLTADPASVADGKIADFTFDDLQTGFSGAGAVVRPFLTYDTDQDNKKELYLAQNNRAYFSVKNAQNLSPLQNKQELTISYDVKPQTDTEGYAYKDNKWVFSASSQDNATFIGAQETVKEARVWEFNDKQSKYTLPELRADVQSDNDPSGWRHVDIVIDKNYMTYYVNGIFKEQIPAFYPLKDFIGEDGGKLEIGRNSKWNEYYGGYIDNFRIYDKALVPQVDNVYILSKNNSEWTNNRVKVLAGHLREEIEVYAVITDPAGGSRNVTLSPKAYDVQGYKSQNGNQNITVSYGGKTSASFPIYVYNKVKSTQSQVLDENGKPMFTLRSTWYDYLTDPEREGKGNYRSNSYYMLDENGDRVDKNNASASQGPIVSSEAEYVQFNKAIDQYWRSNNLDVKGDGPNGLQNRHFPIYWGDFYSLDEAYRGYDFNPDNDQNRENYKYLPGEGASWKDYGQNFYGAVWGYNAHQFCTAAAQGIFDPELKQTDQGSVISIGNTVTPYFNEAGEKALPADEHGDVYMNIYENVLMPFRVVKGADGIDYFEFESGDVGGETIYISDDPANTVQYKADNPCTDARLGTGDLGLDGYSFMPFNDVCDKSDANCGFGMKLEFDFFSTYDGKLSGTNGERVPIIFDFIGDDEFMMYIDGKKAIDIGGSHGQCRGYINFADQTVLVSSAREIETYEMTESRNPNNPSVGTINSNIVSTFEELGLDFSDPTKEHKVTIYYTERGKLEGNLRMRFNFPQENSLTVKKTVDTSEVNPALKADMDEIIANERYYFEIASDYKNAEGDKELHPLEGERIVYNDGANYTEGIVHNGYVELSAGQSFMLLQRVGTEADPTGFLNQEGDLFSISERIHPKRYSTSWELKDTDDVLLGSGHDITAGGGVYLDDPNTVDYANGKQNLENQFAIYNQDGKEIIEKDGTEHIDLNAEYINKVRTQELRLTKKMLEPGTENPEDIFKFRLLLSNLFGYPSSGKVYTGSYSVLDKDGNPIEGRQNVAINSDPASKDYGFFELHAGETAVIEGIPSMTDYQFREYLTEGEFGTDPETGQPRQYEVVGGYRVEGTVDMDQPVVDNVITNMTKSVDRFYAWRNHETTLPIADARAIYSSDTAYAEQYENNNYSAKVAADGIQFTGKIFGNLVLYYQDTSGARKSVTVHVYEPDNKAYVLDYGLPTDLNDEYDKFDIEDTNSLFIRKSSVGNQEYYTMDGHRLKIHKVEAVTQFLGIRKATADITTGWNLYQNDVTDVKSSLTWNDLQMIYKPSAFMDEADVYQYRVDVKENLDTNMDDPEMTPRNGVRMAGEITVVPADVVYYEDDFQSVTYTGTHSTSGTRQELMQSNDNDQPYGYDEAYANDSIVMSEPGDLILHYDFSRTPAGENGQVADQTQIIDISGNNNHGILRVHDGNNSGITNVVKDGNTLRFEDKPRNESAYIELPRGLNKDKTALTVSMWVKSGIRDVINNVWCVKEAGSGNSKYWMFTPEGRVRNFVKNGGGESDAWVSEALPADRYTLCTLVMEDNHLKTYLNGELKGESNTDMRLADLPGACEAYIGKSGYDADYYRGSIRDVRVYDTALTPDRIQELYLESGMLAHYDFSKVQTDALGNVSANAVIPDQSGNGKDAYLRVFNNNPDTNVTIAQDTLSFNSDTQASYIELPKNLHQGLNSMTVSMWVDTNRLEPGNNVWCMKEENSDSEYWMFTPGYAGQYRHFATKNNAGAEYVRFAGKVIEGGAWCTFTIKDGTLSTYINGVKQEDVTHTDPNGILRFSDFTDSVTYIGRSGYGGDFFQGAIRDVRVYGRALTDGEVKALLAPEQTTPDPDSAGSSTRLTADDAARGAMSFSFKGRGFDLIGRSTTETAGLLLTIRKNDANGELEKVQILDTSYANGKLFQLPLISVKNLEYGTHYVEVKAMKTQNRADATLINDSIYIDAIRIYDPANAKGDNGTKSQISQLYQQKEYQADKAEVRELLLGSVKFENLEDMLQNSQTADDITGGISGGTTTSSAESTASLVSYDSVKGTLLYHSGQAQVENPDPGGVIEAQETLEKILKRGPNNEVYLARGNAVAFRAIPIMDKLDNGSFVYPVSERTLQIEAKKVAEDGQGKGQITLLTNQEQPQTIDLNTYTSMYYTIQTTKCRTYSDGSILIILASTGSSMVSLTNLKVRGYRLAALTAEEMNMSTTKQDVYSMMKMMFAPAAEIVPQQPVVPDPVVPDPVVPDPDDPKPLPFTDVAEDSWYAPYVRYVYERELMKGVMANTFAPEQKLCRAQFAVILHRMAGEPKVAYADRFSDVPERTFYTDAVIWASQKAVGVITGYTDPQRKGSFGPNDLITREQMVVMMYRYAEYLGQDTSTSSTDDLRAFEDSDQVSAYAREALEWAVAEKLIRGDNGNIIPQGYMNRAECAAVIQRFEKR